MSRHREIIAINATDGENIPVFVYSDCVSLSNRSTAIERLPPLHGATASSSRGKPSSESHKISTALYFYTFQRLFIGRSRPPSSALGSTEFLPSMGVATAIEDWDDKFHWDDSRNHRLPRNSVDPALYRNSISYLALSTRWSIDLFLYYDRIESCVI